MKIIDRYILKGFAFSFMVVFLSMISLAIVVDMVINLDEHMKMVPEKQNKAAAADSGAEQAAAGSPGAGQQQAAEADAKSSGGGVDPVLLVRHIALYYFYRSFEYFQWLAGAVTLIAAAFAMARLNKTNELIAFKASGVSVYRVFWPIILCGMFISGLYVINQQLIMPQFVNELSSKRGSLGSDEMKVSYVVDDQAALIYAPRYIPSQRAMFGNVPQDSQLRYDPVRIIQRDPTSGETLHFIEAHAAFHDPANGGWRLEKGVRFKAGKVGDDVPDGPLQGEPVNFYATNITPSFIERHANADAYEYLSYRSLNRMLRHRAAVNADVVAVAMHKHFSKPLLNLLLLLLGLPLVVGREGKNYMVSVMLCMGIFILVLASDFIASEFGMSGHVPPVLGAWLPVLIFTPVAIISLQRTQT